MRYKETVYWLDTSVGCAKFARQLYNLRYMLRMERGAEDLDEKIDRLKYKIWQYNDKFHMKSFSATHHGRSNDSSAKRRRLDDEGRAGGNCSGDYAELGARGYEVKLGSEDINKSSVCQPPFYSYAALTLDL